MQTKSELTMQNCTQKKRIDQHLHKILSLLFVTKKIDLSGSNPDFLHRRIAKRLLATQSENHQVYLEYLENNPDEIETLLDVLTINVSRFFRNPFTFEYLNKIVIPNIIHTKLKEKQPFFRIWSAGCSSGEEAYSAGIIIDKYLQKNNLNMLVSIFATDIDQKSLKNGKKGKFIPDSLKETKLEIIENYFTKLDGNYTILPRIRDMVHFSEFNLLNNQQYAPEESIYGDFDLIFCRNVLIYFNPEYQEIIFNKLHKAMNSSTLLILGEAEEPTGIYAKKFRKVSNLFKIYKKL